jgi:uncharacterized protein (UPF0548 family)
LKGEIDAFVATGEIADPSGPLVVMAVILLAADAAARFFRRRCRLITTARESPKTPWTLGRGTKPGNRYRSWSNLNLAIAKA